VTENPVAGLSKVRMSIEPRIKEGDCNAASPEFVRRIEAERRGQNLKLLSGELREAGGQHVRRLPEIGQGSVANPLFRIPSSGVDRKQSPGGFVNGFRRLDLLGRNREVAYGTAFHEVTLDSNR